MVINNYASLTKAKSRLEILIDRHKYNQMLAGGSKLVIDPEIVWITKAITKFENDHKEEIDPYENSVYF